jgi:flagellar hook-associated protein 2
MAGTSSVSGLASGLDWKNIITQLKAVEQKKIDMIGERKKTEQDRLSAWQSMNTKLLSLKTAAETLNETKDFNAFSSSLSSNSTTDAEDILSVTTSTDTAPGTYQIQVKSLASAQKLSSTSFASQTTALGFSGDMIIGGRAVKIAATDSLNGVRDKINAVNSGTNASEVTASIVNYGTTGYRLILTNDEEGANGIGLLNGGSSNLIGTLGFVDASAQTAKNTVTGGHASDSFSYADKAIGGSDLLNLTSAQSGSATITIDGTAKSVSMNLATDSLNTIRDAINTAFSGVFTSNPASVTSKTDDKGNTTYSLLIEGNTITYADANNVLETIGILKRAGVSNERGVTGDVANTSGGVAINSSTLIKDLDGYNDYASGNTITLTGTSTSGGSVSNVFTINDTTTIDDLLTEIETRYGGVTATVTADGKIRVLDNEIGDTDLAVVLTPSSSRVKFDTDSNLGSISTIRARQIQAGADASITIDGVELTPTSNTVNDVIPGLTLNLKKADENTTITLSIGRDDDAVTDKIKGFIDAYNETMDAINTQLTYDAKNQKAGGPLFGDSTLRMIKRNLLNLIVTKVSGVDEDFSTLGLVGINLDKTGKLAIGDDFKDYLKTNFNDVTRLFAADWTSTNSSLSYIRHSMNTKAGTYNIQIDSVNPVSGYFAASGDTSGSGEYLTGLSGDSKDLLVRYSGTATGSVGSLTLTYGVAELLDRELYRTTDSIYGYLPDKNETIQKAIDRYDREISTREARVDKQMEILEIRFIKMETLISSLQNQSNWLTAALSKL